MIEPKISVVTVCYNAVNDIEKTILSVINQTYPNVEYLIIDGGSTDGTMDVVNRYKDKIDVIVSEPDKGIYDAMNKGISRATGEWINFMNAGDYFENMDILQMINLESRGHGYTKVVYGDVRRSSSMDVQKAKNITSISHQMPFCHQSSFVRLPLKKFDTNFKIAADYKSFYDLYALYGKKSFEYIPIVISVFEDSDGISSRAIEKLQNETLSIMSVDKNFWFYFLTFKLNIVRAIRKWLV